jgi:hypothetical protein
MLHARASNAYTVASFSNAADRFRSTTHCIAAASWAYAAIRCFAHAARDKKNENARRAGPYVRRDCA